MADQTFWTTVLMMVRCSSSMEAPLSTSSRLSGASGWTEDAGSIGLLLLAGVRLPRSGTVDDSGAVSGLKPDLEPWGSCPLYSWSPGGCLAAPPGPPPLAPELVVTPLWRHPQHRGRQRAELNSRPMNPGSLSATRRARPWAGCMIIFDIRESCATKGIS